MKNKRQTHSDKTMLQMIADLPIPFEDLALDLNTDIMCSDALLKSTTITDTGDSEKPGELRDEVEIGDGLEAAPFTDGVVADGSVLDDEEPIEVVDAPVSIDACIYRDYYDNFGALLFPPKKKTKKSD
jgi:hypothetical protein